MNLPVLVQPGPWEQLPGFLIRASRLLLTTPSTLLASLGVRPANRVNALRGLASAPGADVISAVESAFPRPFDASRHTMMRFLGVPSAEDSGSTSDRLALADGPVRALWHGSLFCGLCVGAGYWDIRWKTGISTVCLRHLCYLQSRCTACGAHVAPDYMLGAEAPVDGLPPHGTSAATACRSQVSLGVARASSEQIALEHRVHVLLDRAQVDGEAVASWRNLWDWTDLVYQAESGDRLVQGDRVRTSGSDLSRLLTKAERLNRRPDGQVEEAILDLLSELEVRQGHPLRGSKVASEVWEAAASPRSTPSTTSDADIAPRWGGEPCPVHVLPQAMPLDLYIGLFADLLGDIPVDRGRKITAVSLAARPNVSWRATVSSLKLPEGTSRVTCAALAHLARRGSLEEYWERIAEARTELVGMAENFAERRRDVAIEARRLADPTPAVRHRFGDLQWLWDRWACGAHGLLRRPTAPTTGRVTDHRPVRDARTEDVERLWRRPRHMVKAWNGSDSATA